MITKFYIKNSMKQINFFFLATLLFSGLANAQITKGNWMVGGSGNFYADIQYSNKDYFSSKTYHYNLNTGIGYFFLNKLATGLKISYEGFTPKYEGPNSSSLYSIGPYARYYFLNPEKNYNLFIESSYLVGAYSSGDFKNESRAFNISAGPTIYFNSSVGIEFFLQYSNFKFREGVSNSAGIQAGIGFQIYLEKNN
jgi:hypothetical protein